MPLITVVGFPLSGKTTRATQLKQYLENWIMQNKPLLAQLGLNFNADIVVINDESLSANVKDAYANAHNEKIHRANIISAVERHLTRNKVVICDGLNYIKGFRYQLYCVARGIGTPVCTLLCGMNPQLAISRNAIADRYSAVMLENLISRFEEPDGRNRWDAPLYIVIDDDPALDLKGNTTSQKIVESALLKVPPPANVSTIVTPLQATNYLTEMDILTNSIIDAAVAAQKMGRQGKIKVAGATADLQLPSRSISISEWRRLKRQFMKQSKLHTESDLGKCGTVFTLFLNSNIG